MAVELLDRQAAAVGRCIVARHEPAIDRVQPVAAAKADHKSMRESGIGKIKRDRIIADALPPQYEAAPVSRR